MHPQVELHFSGQTGIGKLCRSNELHDIKVPLYKREKSAHTRD